MGSQSEKANMDEDNVEGRVDGIITAFTDVVVFLFRSGLFEKSPLKLQMQKICYRQKLWYINKIQ